MAYRVLFIFLKGILQVTLKPKIVIGKLNSKRMREKNKKEGRPWKAGCIEFIWLLIPVPKTQPSTKTVT